MVGNLYSYSMKSSITEFSILKAFDTFIKPSLTSSIILVFLLCPPCFWMKCSSDGNIHESPSPATCGGLFQYRVVVLSMLVVSLTTLVYKQLFMHNFLVLYELLKL